MAGVLVAIGLLMPLINEMFVVNSLLFCNVVTCDRLKQWLWYNEIEEG